MAAMNSPANKNALVPKIFCAPLAAPKRRATPPLPSSTLVNEVVRPALAEAERVFSAALGRINIEHMAKQAHAHK